ncbi:iron-siderophore ABC transporter substrate-binding protein [Pseudonocardia nigra]|uniref:iron-siderophore ABC transporter substrate-binding protein n=1 Tax=Pseudonocardia nigra TaxID=1921578 RepID=UPI001C5E2BD1|nr:iron-siderophore ABC transporter substrate-binding protein [Pseudonocardia nigra]
MRLRFLPRAAAALLAAAVLLTACGGGAEPAEAPAPAAGDGPFPVSVEHQYGTTVVPEEPQRVISLGYTDQDAILALGVVPVAIREFTGNQPSATWPWAQDELQGQQPQVLSGEINPEMLAALRPDLIVAVSAGLTREQYDTYSQIAPTVSQPAGFVDYGTPWQDATRLIGAALGRADRAEQLVTDLEARFAAVREEHPEFAGTPAVVAAVSAAGPGTYYVWSSQDGRGRFLTSLGFEIPQRFDELAGESFYAELSIEQLGLLDEAQLVAWIPFPGAENSALEQQPGYSTLRVAQEGRVVNLTDEQAAALSFSTVLSLPSVLDTLPDQFAEALPE